MSRAQSESRQTLGAVVRDCNAGDFIQRSVWLRRISDEFRGVPVDLIEIRSVWRKPVVARSTADVAAECPERAVSRNLGAGGVLRDLQPLAVDVKRADVAVAEVRRIHDAVIG